MTITTPRASRNLGRSADIFVDRFSLNPNTGAVGLIEHIAGQSCAPAGSESAANGSAAANFPFASTIGNLHENLHASTTHPLFFLQANRIRRLELVSGTWELTAVTRTLDSAATDFVLTSDVDDEATAGHIYYVDAGTSLHAYARGSGASASALGDDVITTVAFPGLDTMTIRFLGIRSTGELIFSDEANNGTIYGFTP